MNESDPRSTGPQSTGLVPMSVDSTSLDPGDIRNILAPDQLAKLRGGYIAEVMNRAATAALIGPFPPATPIAEFIIGHFYRSERWEPARREQCVITYFASRAAGNEANLGIHIYWGMMEGLSADVIGDTILLAAAYSGIENYTNGIGVMTHVLTVLRALIEDPDPGAVECMNVVKKLRR
jgi:alkylhydroperoxidase/carboxymuconolactone decarboxylase family protein YurZ